jgi:hypothetical protein
MHLIIKRYEKLFFQRYSYFLFSFLICLTSALMILFIIFFLKKRQEEKTYED